MSKIIFADVLEDHFRRAAAHIETNGWYKGTWFESYDSPDDLPTDCPSCILGSLLVTCKSENIRYFMQARTSLYYRVTSHYLDFLEASQEELFGSVVEWNDHLADSAQEVIDKLNQAADDIKYKNASFLAFVKYVKSQDYEWVFKWRN